MSVDFTYDVRKSNYGLCIGLIALLVVCFFACAAMPQTAEAATASSKTIFTCNSEYGKTQTVSQCDITNDGKKDAVRFVVSPLDRNYDCTLSVYINGKRAYYSGAVCAGTSVKVKLFTLKNGKKYIYIHQLGMDEEVVGGVYAYSGGKLKACFSKPSIKGNASLVILRSAKVSGNSVKVIYSAQPYRIGLMKFTYTYKYKNGSLKRTSSSTSSVSVVKSAGGYSKGYFSTVHKINAKSSASDKAKTKTLSKNTKVKVAKVSIKGKTMWFKLLSKSGKTYWVKNLSKMCSKNTGYYSCLKEGTFAG